MTDNKPYFENLDVLRFVAAFSVFFFHLGQDLNAFFTEAGLFHWFKYLTKITSKGALGVNFFFVLSGFLITYLMLWEVKKTNAFSYKKFLVRRTLRIWPLYFLIVLIGFFVFPRIIEGYHTQHSATWYLFFLANFDEIRVGAFDSINFLTSPWSIAVEEQFYVIWGLLGLLFLSLMKPNKVYLKYAVYALLCVSLVFRWMHWDDARVLYYNTLSVMPDLLFGCLMALYWDKNPAFFDKIKEMSKTKIMLIYGLGVLMILFKNIIFAGNLVVFERYAIAFFFCFVVIDQIQNQRLIKSKVMRKTCIYLGKISYGIYMFHLVVMYLTSQFLMPKAALIALSSSQLIVYALLFVGASITMTILLATLSFIYFEKPFLKLKERF